jgi:hypothetical protein
MNKTVDKTILWHLFFIWVIASTNYICLHEYALLSGKPEMLRRMVKFGVIGAIYWLGDKSFQRVSAGWPRQIWQLIYSIGLMLIIGSGIYHQLTQARGTLLSTWMGSLSTALQSPIVFLAILLLTRMQRCDE